MNDSRAGVFINYRTEDSDFAALTLRQHLVERLGQDEVWSERSISPGQQWQPALTEAVRNSKVTIVLIGPNWLTATDEHGIRRVDRKSDWVRREIEAAAQAGTWIIPVLLPGAPSLNRNELPASLAALAERQYFRLDPSDMTSAINELVEVIAQLLHTTDNSADAPAPVSHSIPMRGELVAAVTESPDRRGRPNGPASMRIRREAVPNGPIRDFFDRLHELHRWAGEPSTRRIASGIGKGVISYGTVYAALRGPQVPRWGHVELIVEELDGDIDVFRQAWVDARDAEDKLRAEAEFNN